MGGVEDTRGECLIVHTHKMTIEDDSTPLSHSCCMFSSFWYDSSLCLILYLPPSLTGLMSLFSIFYTFRCTFISCSFLIMFSHSEAYSSDGVAEVLRCLSFRLRETDLVCRCSSRGDSLFSALAVHNQVHADVLG